MDNKIQAYNFSLKIVFPRIMLIKVIHMIVVNASNSKLIN
jgi:hypothetical protein